MSYTSSLFSLSLVSWLFIPETSGVLISRFPYDGLRMSVAGQSLRHRTALRTWAFESADSLRLIYTGYQKFRGKCTRNSAPLPDCIRSVRQCRPYVHQINGLLRINETDYITFEPALTESGEKNWFESTLHLLLHRSSDNCFACFNKQVENASYVCCVFEEWSISLHIPPSSYPKSAV